MRDGRGLLEDPDREVLARMEAGDSESFGVLVERHQERLFRLCVRMLGDREEAREAAQEVFLKAFRNAGRFKPRGRVYTWIYRIAVNHCLNRLRRRKIVRFLSFGELAGVEDDGGEAPELDPADPVPDAEHQLGERRRWRLTCQWIDQLPAGQRAVLVLAKFEGLSYRDIADTLGISLGAVESRLFRATRRLNQLRESEQGEI